MSVSQSSAAAGHDSHGHHDNPYLAHHFDTPQQQFESAKLGMWVFLATEILMFGGLFCAYAIYRGNHPEIFIFAHHYLKWELGAINTVILLASSFTMAWGVRAAQLNQQKLLAIMLALTLMGGCGFMIVKAYEYVDKWDHGGYSLWVGEKNVFFREGGEARHEEGLGKALGWDQEAEVAVDDTPTLDYEVPVWPPQPIEPPVIQPPRQAGTGVSDMFIQEMETGRRARGVGVHEVPAYEDLTPLEQDRVHIFFQIYYMMTGLHTLHVLVGLGVIFWLLYRAVATVHRAWLVPMIPIATGLYIAYVGMLIPNNITIYVGIAIIILGAIYLGANLMLSKGKAAKGGAFNSQYYTPVDIGGLYWHLVDLIWIFLFPLLYLIH